MKYIIELVADSKGVQAGVDALEQIEKRDKANAEQFKKTKGELLKYTSTLDGLRKGMIETGKAAAGAFGGEALVNYAKKSKIVADSLIFNRKKYDELIEAQRKLNDELRKQPKPKPPIPEDAPKKAESFKAILRQSRDELTKLLQSGEATTSQIYDMARAGGELKDRMADAQQAINVLSSDTFKLDAALQGIQVGAAGFQILQGAAALAGDENEDLQKTLVRLNAVMAITQGLQQIQNALQKQTALSLGLNIAAQKTYTVVVGTSTGALKAFRIALAATGIGLAVLAIAALVQNWDKLKLSILGATQSSEDFIKAKEKSLEMSEKELEKLEIELKYRQAIGKINDVQAQEQRLKYVSLKSLKTTEELQKETEKLKQMTKDSKEFITVQDMKFDKTVKYAKVNQSQLDEQVKKVNYLISVQKQQVGTIDEERKALEDLIESKKEKIEVEKKEKVSAEDLDKLNIELYIKERKRINDNLESFKLAELAKQEAAAETNRILQEQADILIETNKRNAEKIKETQEQTNRDREEAYQQEIEAQNEKELTIKETAVSIAQETADTIFQIAADRRNAEFNAQLNALNAQKEKELSNKNLTDAQKARIEERYQKQVAALKTRQAQQEKQAAIIQATINGALAITNILATMPGGPLNPATIASLVIAGVTTATNIALIASQKIPKFAKGTEYVNGSGTGTSDSIPAMLSKGERVVDAKTNKMLKGIPNSMLPELLVPSKTVISKGMDYDKLAKTLSKELAKSPQMRVSFDKEGFNSYIMSRNNTTNIKNNRYDF